MKKRRAFEILLFLNASAFCLYLSKRHRRRATPLRSRLDRADTRRTQVPTAAPTKLRELTWRGDLACHNPENSMRCPANTTKQCRGDINMIWSIGVWQTDSRPLDILRKLPDVSKSAKSVGLEHPIQTGADVSDIPANFVADPFLVHDATDEKIWYIFSEVPNNICQKGEIGLHISVDDAKTWKYAGIVLAETWHLSFPVVVRDNGKYYMTTSATPGRERGAPIILYVATDFPRVWTRLNTIAAPSEKGRVVDPMLHHHTDGLWYLFFKDNGQQHNRVFVAEQIQGSYTEHPESAKYNGNEQVPAGRFVRDDDGQLWSILHGTAEHVKARKVVELSRTKYVLGDSRMVLEALRYSWAQSGMHTYNAVKAGPGRWVGVVDGWWEDATYSVHTCVERNPLTTDQCNYFPRSSSGWVSRSERPKSSESNWIMLLLLG